MKPEVVLITVVFILVALLFGSMFRVLLNRKRLATLRKQLEITDENA